MAALTDLTFLGAPVGDPVAIATFISRMVLTKRQKAQLLRDYLSEKRLPLTVEVRRAAVDYEEHL